MCARADACVCVRPSNVTYHLRDKLFLSLLHLSLSRCGEGERRRYDEGVECHNGGGGGEKREGERERGMNG